MAATEHWQSRRELRQAADAAATVMSIMQNMAQRGQTLPALLSRGAPMTEWHHYPDEDAHDPDTGYRYYYHVHPNRGEREHGHFHLFHYESGQTRPSHLIGIGITAHGLPNRLFTTNRWVTDEHMISGRKILRRIRQFHLERPVSLRSVHDWLAHVIRLFIPQIRTALDQREQRLAGKTPRFFEDRRTELLSSRTLSLERQVRMIERLLKSRPEGEPA